MAALRVVAKGTLVAVFWGVWCRAVTSENAAPRRRQLLEEESQQADSASWQGQSLTFIPAEPPISTIHCIGDNFNASSAWQYRSCVYTNLCWDGQQWVTFPSQAETQLLQYLNNNNIAWQSTVTLSTLLSESHSSVSLQSLLDEQLSSWTADPWFPKVISPQEARQKYTHGYYQLANTHVWIPWQPPISNARHWLWTSWYPLFVLASLFPTTRDKQLLPMVVTTQHLTSLHPAQIAVIQALEQTWGHPLTDGDNKPPVGLICAPHVVVGVGSLAPKLGHTDSIGKGPTLQAFASHVRQSLGAEMEILPVESSPNAMLMGQVSSLALKSIQSAFANLHTLQERKTNLQALMASLSQVTVLFMTLDEECAAPLFVPNHAIIVVLYTKESMRDLVDCVYLLNNLAHLHVQWVDLSVDGALDSTLKQIVYQIATQQKEA